MAKKQNTLRKIQAAVQGVQTIKEKIDINTREYKQLWEKRIEALEKGDHDLEIYIGGRHPEKAKFNTHVGQNETAFTSEIYLQDGWVT